MELSMSGTRPDMDNETPLLTLANLMMRRRWFIARLAFAGATIGLLTGLLSRRVYVAQATFLPQNTEMSQTALAAAASQFGIRLPTNQGAGWGPPVYVALMQSRGLLGPVAADSYVVTEMQGRRVPLADLLDIHAPSPEVRLDRTVIALRRLLDVREAKPLGGVQISVTTRWPAVSLVLAQRLVDEVGRFNQDTRQSQASSERRFVEGRVAEAEHLLREAEDRLQGFLQRNRSLGSSPDLTFARDRLQRDVTLRQQLYTTLLQSYEEARIREVRDTPVLTILEAPRLPVIPAPRGSVLKAAVGLLGGGILGIVFAMIASGLSEARRIRSGPSQEFFALLDQMVPAFLRRRAP